MENIYRKAWRVGGAIGRVGMGHLALGDFEPVRGSGSADNSAVKGLGDAPLTPSGASSVCAADGRRASPRSPQVLFSGYRGSSGRFHSSSPPLPFGQITGALVEGPWITSHEERGEGSEERPAADEYSDHTEC